jgi:hypothetical protein
MEQHSDSNKLILGFVFSAMAILLGWFLNQLGQWFKVRHEDKKNVKKILYHLLEIYFLLLRYDMEDFIKKLSKAALDNIPKEQHTEETRKLLNDIYRNMAENHMRPVIVSEFKKLEESYAEAIKELSGIFPLIAFELSGKASIIQRLEGINTWVESLQNSNINISTIGINKGVSISTPLLIKDTIADFENILLKISQKIGFSTWLRTRKTIKEMKHQVDAGFEMQLNTIMSQVKEQIASSAQPVG